MTVSIDPPARNAPPEAWDSFIAAWQEALADGDDGAQHWIEFGRDAKRAAEARSKKTSE